jgi:transglutaminase-like putative cysteine protease
VQEIVSPNDSDLLKLRKLVGWISTKVTYGGKRVGSRDPVAAVLERRFGRCWEKADLLVTLARAARLPTRQVAGWLVGGQGHIWVEVLVEGRGWLSVDATAPWIGVAGSYVPLMTTTDGHMPVMHLKKPKIERLDGKSR